MLTQTAVQKMKFKEQRYRKTDYDGLMIEIQPSKSKIWKYRYTFQGKRKMMTLGHFPYMGLLDARKKRDEAKASLMLGRDPNELQPKSRANAIKSTSKDNGKRDEGPTFLEVFNQMARMKTKQHGDNKPEWGSRTYSTHLKRLNKHVFPFFGDIPVSQFTDEILQARLEEIQSLGVLETRDKVFVLLKQLFKFAKGKKFISSNPMIEVTKDLFVKKKSKNYKHVTTEQELKKALEIIRGLRGSYIVVKCIQMSVHVFLRASEITALEWENVDFENKLITAKTTKTAEANEVKEHLIPISMQVLAMLRELHKYTGNTKYVFKSSISLGPISGGSINKNIRDNGLNSLMTHHGMRHTASTFLNEQGFNSDDVELQLNHSLVGVRGIYNKAKRIEPRRIMMQAWSDYLDSILKN